MEIHKTSVKPSKSHQNEDNQKVRILRKRVCCKKMNAEVLLGAMPDKAKEARKKKQRDFINAVEPVIDVQSQEYLTFSKAAILMGCSRQYIYKLIN